MSKLKRASQKAAVFLGFTSLCAFSAAQDISFGASGLIGESLNNPTSLDFGPDGRLYVSQQDGEIFAFTITRDDSAPGLGSYTVTDTEAINTVQINTPNHTDDGVVTTIKLRQVTGIHTAGTAQNPVLYVTSSDNLIGGGGGINDKNLDTNSGVLSKLSWDGDQWNKIDLVRGLPRCEENHSINGMDIFEKNGETYMLVQQGGHSNKGAPSNNFVGTPEYFLSGTLLIVNLTQLESMPVYTDPRSNTQYIYDLPTLNDPEREDIANDDPRFPYPSAHPLYNATIDVGDPFGGNDGLNQAFAEAGGPVQIFSAGYRNAYDVIITESGAIFTSDNGPNTGWGGLPLIYNSDDELKGDQSNTNYAPEDGDYIKNEFNEVGSVGHGDPLHYVGTVEDANGTYYGGHPIPILAFPSRADLITYKNIDGEWTETARYSLAEVLPGVSGYFNTSFSTSDFPDDPRLGNYLSDVASDDSMNILDIINSSTNGITEYTASNFDGALQGDILTASFNGNINRYKLNEVGDEAVISEVIFNGFGATPLDVIALPDGHPFAGTVWAATYGADNITIFEPSDVSCTGINDPDFDPNDDNDNDGYSNQDEIDNGTNFCSGGSTPKDNDVDFISDLNDSDDDNDGIEDVADAFAIDAANGMNTVLPVLHPFWNNDPGTGFFGLGFTGLMLDPSGNTDYLTQFDENNMSFGGAAGKASIDLIPDGDAFSGLNTQQYGFQFGVNVDNATPTFTIHSRLESPFFGIDGNSTDPEAYQAAGIFIGNGDQNNYLKVVLGFGTLSTDDVDGVEVLLENNGSISSARYDVPNLLDGNAVDIYINIASANNLAQTYVSADGGATVTALGNPITLPSSFLDGSDDQGMAVGLISTSNGPGAPFSAIWDFINLTEDQPGILQTSAEENGLDFGELTSGDADTQLNLSLKNLSGPADDPVTITGFNLSGADAQLFAAVLSTPLVLGPGGEVIIPISFTTGGAIGDKSATLEIFHSGDSSPISITLSATVQEPFGALLRINAGGSLVVSSDAGPDWLADNDTVAQSSFSINTGNLAGFDLSYADKDASIPDYIDQVTFEALFSSERWDASSGADMEYSIPLPNGDYEVKLYLGNGYGGTATVGSRVYDILIEGNIVSDNVDLITTFGHTVGGMLSFPVTVSDNELNIGFDHEVENPLVNAIEIFAPVDLAPSLSLAPIIDRSEQVGTQVDFAVVAGGGNPTQNYNYSIFGQPDGIQIEPTNGQIFGNIANTALSGGIAHDGVHDVVVTVSQGDVSASQQFTWVVTAPELSWVDKDESEDYVGRHECSFVQAGDSFIMFGGRESAQQLDVYDYNTNTWSTGGPAPVEFNHFQAIEYQGFVWVISAFQDNDFPNETPATHIYMYNPATQEWIQGREIPENRRRGGAGLVVHDDKFYILGGNTIGHNGGYVAWFDVYDPATGEWNTLADAPHARDHFHATLFGDKLYAIGGRLSGGEGGVFAPLIAEVDVYDFDTASWSTLNSNQNLPTPRAAPGVANFDSKIFVMGGEGTEPGPAFDIVEVFDPNSGAWTDGPTMNHGRHGTQAIVSGGGLYIAGGSPNRGGGNQKNMEVLGEDQPSGIILTPSTLSADQDTIDFTYSASDGSVILSTMLSNTVGNTAIYIQSIDISGDNFALAENYDHRLIAAGSELSVGFSLENTLNALSTGLITVVIDNGESLKITLTGVREGNETIVYRVNAGGSSLSDPPLPWAQDLISAPSAFVNSGANNKTHTDVHSGFINNTPYNTSLYNSTRFNQLNAPNNMQWDFPAENGFYQVNLLFAEVWTGATSPGVRIFDVELEGDVVLENFDMSAKYGWITAGVESFIIDVNDGNIDINLIKKTQNPHINAIEIIHIE